MEIDKIIKTLQERFTDGYKMGLYSGNEMIIRFRPDENKAIQLAIAALERQRETTYAPCSFCEQLEENNMECCIAGEDFIEPIYCPVCGRELEG